MICPICKTEIIEDSKFCPKCGKRIPRCPTCNKVITNRIKFCIYDGTPLPEEIFSGFLDMNEVNSVELNQSTQNILGKKKRKILPLLCIVLFLGVAGVLGYSIYNGDIPFDSFSQKSTETRNTENESDRDQTFIAQSAIEDESEEIEYEKDEFKKEEFKKDGNNLIETLGQIVLGTEQTTSSVETDAAETVATEQASLAIEEKKEAPQVSMDAISRVSATSYLTESEYNLVHNPSNVVDGSLSNAWVEGVPGHGEGESITIQLDETYKLSGFNINAGYQKNADVFEKNSRPATLLITFSDGSGIGITLKDINEQQQVTFPSAIETSSVTFTIQSVYPGSKFEDTVISEIQLF